MKTYYQLVAVAALLGFAALVGVVGAAVSPPIVEWTSVIGGPGVDTARDIFESGDGGYLLVGNTTPVNGTEDAFLVKIDANGTQLWTKTFGGPGNDSFTAIEKASGGFILTGYTASGPNAPARLLLTKIDTNGTKLFEANFSGRGQAEGYEVLETSDGSFIAVGRSAADGRSPNDIYLVKADKTGKRLWEKYYGGNGEDRGFAIVRAADSGYVVAGSMTQSGATYADAYLLKIDSEGNRAWEKFYGSGDRHEVAFDVDRTADGGFLVVGRSFTGTGYWDAPRSSEIYVLRVDKDGVKQWEKTYGGSGFDRAWDGEEVADGYVLFGSKTVADGTEDFELMKLGRDGVLIWETNLSAGHGHDRGFASEPTSDGGWILVGETDSRGAGARDIMVTKVSAEGVAVNTTAARPVNTTANATPTLLPTTPPPTVTGTSNATAAIPPTTRAPVGLPAMVAALAGIGLLARRRR